MKCPTCDHDSQNTPQVLIAAVKELKQRIAHLEDQRRERIATAAMAGIITDRDPQRQPFTNEQAAQWACILADALIEELDRGK